MATDRGVLLGDRPFAFPDSQVTAVVDDLQGGVVVETPGPVISRLPAGEDEPVRILPGEGEAGSLFQVAQIDDSPALVLLVKGSLELHELPTADRSRVAEVGQAVTHVSFARGRFAVTGTSDGCGRIYLLDLSGAEEAVPGLPECGELDEATLSSDGARLAYLAGNELVVLELETGSELLRRQVAEGPDGLIVTLDFDGDWVVMGRAIAPGGPGQEVVGLSVSGARFLARVPGIRWVWLPRAPLATG